MKRIATFEEVYRLQSVLTYPWWILVALTVVPLVVWWRFVDKKRLFEIMTYGLLVSFVAGLLDAIGVETDAWEYKYDLVPLLDVFIAYDISVLPVSYMLVYQRYKNWRSFIMAHVVLAFVFAFVAEPLLVWLDIYQLIGWKHIYSVPGYIAIAICLRGVMAMLLKSREIEQRSQ
jgi:hypothetical protein